MSNTNPTISRGRFPEGNVYSKIYCVTVYWVVSLENAICAKWDINSISATLAPANRCPSFWPFILFRLSVNRVSSNSKYVFYRNILLQQCDKTNTIQSLYHLYVFSLVMRDIPNEVCVNKYKMSLGDTVVQSNISFGRFILQWIVASQITLQTTPTPNEKANT